MTKEREKELLSHLVHAHHKIERQQSYLERLKSERLSLLVRLQYAALAPQKRERIADVWKQHPPIHWPDWMDIDDMFNQYCEIVAVLFDIHKDTVRHVLQEDGTAR